MCASEWPSNGDSLEEMKMHHVKTAGILAMFLLHNLRLPIDYLPQSESGSLALYSDSLPLHLRLYQD